MFRRDCVCGNVKRATHHRCISAFCSLYFFAIQMKCAWHFAMATKTHLNRIFVSHLNATKCKFFVYCVATINILIPLTFSDMEFLRHSIAIFFWLSSTISITNGHNWTSSFVHWSECTRIVLEKRKKIWSEVIYKKRLVRLTSNLDQRLPVPLHKPSLYLERRLSHSN